MVHHTNTRQKKRLIKITTAALIGLAIIGSTVFIEQQIGGTYFTYKPIHAVALYITPSELEMSPRELYLWDEKAYSLVRKYSLSPTVASKIYAYLLTAEEDAAKLSYEAKGRYAGTIAPVAGGVLCTFFPHDCPFIKEGITDDVYSRGLARIVLANVEERIASDGGEDNIYPHNTISHPKPGLYEKPKGDAYWNGTDPMNPETGSWKTWKIGEVSNFRPGPPPVYGGAEDLREIEVVKNSLRNLTEEQALAVQYWAMGPGTETPSGVWLKKLTHITKKENTPLPKLLEVRSALAQVLADACIVVWDTKYTYWTKRPYMRDVAIQELRSAVIKPYVVTPNFPSYISGHSTMSAAAATVLSHYYPKDKEYFFHEAEEAMHSRLWGGIHFSIDDETGFEVGKKVGEALLETSSVTPAETALR